MFVLLFFSKICSEVSWKVCFKVCFKNGATRSAPKFATKFYLKSLLQIFTSKVCFKLSGNKLSYNAKLRREKLSKNEKIAVVRSAFAS